MTILPIRNQGDTLTALDSGACKNEFRMPAEWESHAATWLAWPHNRSDWPGKFQPVQWVYAEIIRNLARHEPVNLVVKDAAAERQARKVFGRSGANAMDVRFHHWRTNRVWLRDSGCIFVKSTCGAGTPARENREVLDFSGANQQQEKIRASAAEVSLLALKFRFNAWAKYSNWRCDEKIGSLMANAAGSQEIRPTHRESRIVLEGGSIDVNGCGTLLTTEECLLSRVQQRNPGMSRKDYEKIFADCLGASHVIWLGKGIRGDDTHGHVDDLSRFVAPTRVVTMVEPNRRDINHGPLLKNLRRLRSARDQAGKTLDVIDLPMPSPVIFEKRRLPASYANFYIANGVVIVPVFNDPNDRLALNTLAALFPTREIVPIYSGDLVWGFGALHCMTQQQPSA